MKHWVYQMPLWLAGLLLAGCATAPQNCNVHAKDESLLTKLGCADADRQTVQTAANELELARAENQAFRKAYEDLETEKAAVGKSLQERQKAHQQAQASLSAMLSKVKARRGNKADVQAQIAELEKQLQAQNSLPASNTSAVLKQRQKERDDLRRKVQALELSLGN